MITPLYVVIVPQQVHLPVLFPIVIPILTVTFVLCLPIPVPLIMEVKSAITEPTLAVVVVKWSVLANHVPEVTALQGTVVLAEHVPLHHLLLPILSVLVPFRELLPA